MKTIGVFFGSRSPEHDISIITGQLALSGLRGLGYPVVPVYLDKTGQWLLGEPLGTLKTFQSKETDFSKFKAYNLDLEQSVGKLVFTKKGLFGGKEIVIDIAFPTFHGPNGEDGSMQGLFEMFNLPYVGCGVTASATAMDKIQTKILFEKMNVLTTKFTYVHKQAWEKDKPAVLSTIRGSLHGNLFVKPASLGSSIGIGKVRNDQELEQALDVALHYDSRAIIEEAVENLADLTCAVLGNDHPRPSLIQESKIGQDGFFSYGEKYLDQGGAQFGKAESKFVIPAELPKDITKKIQDGSVEIFKFFGCSGIARVDWLYNRQSGELFANEINPLPGTFYHHLWQKSGLAFPELLKELVRLAEERQAAKKEIVSTFESSVLTQPGMIKGGKANL